jgi:hypothetical protein
LVFSGLIVGVFQVVLYCREVLVNMTFLTPKVVDNFEVFLRQSAGYQQASLASCGAV